MKNCSKCGTTKSLDSFNKRAKSNDGLQYACKECELAIRKKSKVTKQRYDKERYEDNRAYYIEKAMKRTRQLDVASYIKDSAYVKDLYSQIKELEHVFKDIGLKFHVDHIVPLQNEKVCGLHCEANLQILTAEDNLSKSNKLI